MKMPRSACLSNFTCEPVGNIKLNIAICIDFRATFSSISITAVLMLSNGNLLKMNSKRIEYFAAKHSWMKEDSFLLSMQC